MKRGFTLIEMLVVIGIIAVLIGASLAGFSKMLRSAEKTQATELLSNTVTALSALYESDGLWPKALRQASGGEQRLDANVAVVLATRGYMSLAVANGKLSGTDRFGILTPWAAKIVKRKGSEAQLESIVGGDKTVQDHILRFAIDLDGDGITENAGPDGKRVRATAAVWCLDRDGKDYITSWTKGQEVQ